MSERRYVVAAGNVDLSLAGAEPIVIERRANAVLLEATAADSARLAILGGVSVFRNPAIARTAFEHFEV